MLILCTAVYILFVLIDVIPIIRSKQWKVLTIYSILIITSFTLSVLFELGVKLPSPSYPIKNIVTAIFGE